VETVVIDSSIHKKNFYLNDGQISCPVCGNKMTKVDERKENGAWFVWFECSIDNCDGQSLKKISCQSQDNSVSEECQE